MLPVGNVTIQPKVTPADVADVLPKVTEWQRDVLKNLIDKKQLTVSAFSRKYFIPRASVYRVLEGKTTLPLPTFLTVLIIEDEVKVLNELEHLFKRGPNG